MVGMRSDKRLFLKDGKWNQTDAQGPFEQSSSSSHESTTPECNTPFVDHKEGEGIFVNPNFMNENRKSRSLLNWATVRDQTSEQYHFRGLGIQIGNNSRLLVEDYTNRNHKSPESVKRDYHYPKSLTSHGIFDFSVECWIPHFHSNLMRILLDFRRCCGFNRSSSF